MPITARQVMELAGIALNDVGGNRWPFAELCLWINEGVGAIVLAKPSASSLTVVLRLQAGTYQTIGADYLALLRMVRNIDAAGPPRVGGRFIAVTSRAALDAQMPYWHDQSRTPYRKEVRQIVFDDAAPLDFYVYPGNDGTGMVEAVVSKLPPAIVATGDPVEIASFGQDIGLPDIYLTPLLDYILYRAFSKDSLEANPGAAAARYQAFTVALGAKAQVDAIQNPNRQGAAQVVARPGGG